MVTSTAKNPWIKEGVSILQENPNDLLPIVGQKELFEKLRRFITEDCLADTGVKLSSFFVLHGGWGVGKSRVGHEVCLEAIHDEVKWIVEGKGQRVLEPSLAQGVLPIFTRYVQITNKFGDDLSADSWIPCAAVEALSRLAGLREHETTGNLSKNQDRLLQWTAGALKPKGFDKIKNELATALSKSDPHGAARAAIDILKKIGIKRLLIVIDEIEDITDVEQDGLRTDERTAGAIDQGLLTVIPRVIKSEEVRQEFPELNFLLLCSRAVGDLLKQVRAIERRTIRYDLQSNAFSDVEDFFTYLKTARPEIAGSLESYPEWMKEAAFLAADRNFGWFNVIMHSLHNDHRGGSVPTHELIRKLAATDDRLFDKDAIGSYHVDLGSDEDFVKQTMYGLVPHLIGEGEIDDARAARLLSLQNPNNVGLFTKLREIKPPQDVRITTHLVNCGFRTESGTVVYLPGEARFNLKNVMESLKAYSQIALPADRREHLLISEDEVEFTAQVAALSPYGEQASQFAPYLHGLLIDSPYEVKDEEGNASLYLTPSFTFLQEFHRLNNRRHRVEGLLRDSTKNSALLNAYEKVVQDSKERELRLLRGLANAWEVESAPVEVGTVSRCALPAITMTTKSAPLNLGPDGSAIIIYGANSTDVEIEQSIAKLGKQCQPVVLILEDQDQRIDDLQERIDRASPKVAPFVVIHNLTRQVSSDLVRFGLMGEAFSAEDLRTSHFNSKILTARQHLEQSLRTWKMEVLDQRGLVLAPLFYGSKVGSEELQAFAKGYAAMLTGETYHNVMQKETGVFANDKERDDFNKLLNRQVDPGPKFADPTKFPRLQLVTTEGGDQVASIPRCVLTLMERCSHVGRKRSELENLFLFDLPDGGKAKDVIRHLTDVLCHLGLLDNTDETLKQVSSHVLDLQVKAAEDWLDARFETAVNSIKSIHHDQGARLLDIRGKEARQHLKEARKELDDLSLDFIGKPWDELNRETSDGMPAYEQGLRKSLAVIVKVKEAVRSVFDTESDRLFKYSPEVLSDFEKHQASPTYPLWKRVRILHGFYSDLDKRRRELIKQIVTITDEMERRVPDVHDGEYKDQKAFPLQPLVRPLGAFQQELDFSAEKPNKTVTAGGSSFAIMTVGYKICDGKFREAFERIDNLEAELTQPGKLVAGFRELLGTWEQLRSDTSDLDTRLASITAFFDDAPETVKAEAGIESLQGELEELREYLCDGGIREPTDGRESRGDAILTLVKGLKEDVDEVRNAPANLRERLQGKEAQAVQSLEVRFQSEHGPLIKAVTAIRMVQNKDLPKWPSERAETYGKTKARFTALVEQMRKEGQEYFVSESDVSFDDYVGLCRLSLKGTAIDWDSEYERVVNPLKRLKLLELKLK
ncbi:hypothetical protein [Roseiconus lacunae]|uniref:ATP-binding protein n=1 Tax=Roseiconus lacunae TaxID=2605694 RepID=A0ABT7PPV5_9BACT|nr:hypothetical protein [Roseiconus lacunae]MDM4018181.1 hypothetical protein [Roseiconus lacunae]